MLRSARLPLYSEGLTASVHRQIPSFLLILRYLSAVLPEKDDRISLKSGFGIVVSVLANGWFPQKSGEVNLEFEPLLFAK